MSNRNGTNTRRELLSVLALCVSAVIFNACSDSDSSSDTSCANGVAVGGVCCDTSNGFIVRGNECVADNGQPTPPEGGGPGGQGQQNPPDGGGAGGPANNTSNETTEDDENHANNNTPESPIVEEPTIDEDSCVKIDLANPSVASSVTSVSAKSSDNDVEITLNEEGACIHLTGSLDGKVKIKNKKYYNASVILDNVTIGAADSGSGIKLNGSDIESDDSYVSSTYTLKLIGDNNITGGLNENSKKVINSEANLTIIGDGSLTINAQFKTGIGVDDVFKIMNGNVRVNLARTSDTDWTVTDSTGATTSDPEKGFGVKVVNGFEMTGGALTIVARDSVTMETGYEARGLKVDGIDNKNGDGKGYINIQAGNIVIQSDSKAMTAGYDADEDAVFNTGTPKPNVYVSGGNINIKTYMSPIDNDQPGGRPGQTTTSTASRSPEGLEAKGSMEISGGNLFIQTTDDAINTGEKLTISGGRIVAISSSNDAIDSNGTIVITGGLTAAFGAGSPEGGLDADDSRNVTYSGGTLFAIGGSNNAPGTVTLGSFLQSGGSGFGGGGFGGGGFGGGGSSSTYAGKVISFSADGSSDVLAAVTIPENYNGGSSVLLLHPSLTKGSSYQMNVGATLTLGSDASWFSADNNIILDGSASTSGGTATAITAGNSSSGGWR